MPSPLPPLVLPQHPDQHRPERPVLLAVDQQLGREVVRAQRILEFVPQESVTAILKTTDVAGTIEWYRRVGFEIRDVFPESGEPTWCEVSRDGVVLQFLGGETPWPGPPTFTGTIYFRPGSVEAFFEEIKDHTTPAWGPEVREWGDRELGLQDNNGYFLTFTEPAP